MSQHLHTGQVAQINEDIPNTDGYTNFIGERRGKKTWREANANVFQWVSG